MATTSVREETWESQVRDALPDTVSLRLANDGRHWLFDADGRRVLEFWPSNRRYWSPATREKGKAVSAEQLLEVLSRTMRAMGLEDERVIYRTEDAAGEGSPGEKATRRHLERIRATAGRLLEVLPGIDPDPATRATIGHHLEAAAAHLDQVAWLVRRQGGRRAG
jgi:hypothetical protein